MAKVTRIKNVGLGAVAEIARSTLGKERGARISPASTLGPPPKLMTAKKAVYERDKRIVAATVRLSLAEHAELTRLACVDRLSVGEFLRRLVLPLLDPKEVENVAKQIADAISREPMAATTKQRRWMRRNVEKARLDAYRRTIGLDYDELVAKGTIRPRPESAE